MNPESHQQQRQQVPFFFAPLSAPSPFLGPAYVPTPPNGAARAFGASGGDGARRLSSSSLATKSALATHPRFRSGNAESSSVLVDPAALLEAQARAPLDPCLSPLFAVDGVARLGVGVFEGGERRKNNSNANSISISTTSSSTLPLLPLAPHPAAEDAPPWLERLLWPPPTPPHDILLSRLPSPSVIAGYHRDWLELDAAGAGAAWDAAALEPCSNPKGVSAVVVCSSRDAEAASRFVFGEVAGAFERCRLGRHGRDRGLPGGGGGDDRGVFTFDDVEQGGGEEGGFRRAATRLRAALRLSSSSCWQGGGAGSLEGAPESSLVVYVVPGRSSSSPPSPSSSFADSPRDALSALLEVSAALSDPKKPARREVRGLAAPAPTGREAAAAAAAAARRQRRPLAATLQLVPRSALPSLSASSSSSSAAAAAAGAPLLPPSEPSERAARAVAFAVFSKLPSASSSSGAAAHEPLLVLAGDGDCEGEQGVADNDRDGEQGGGGDGGGAAARAGRTLHCCYLPVSPPHAPAPAPSSPPSSSAADAAAADAGNESGPAQNRDQRQRLVAVAWTDSRGLFLHVKAIKVPAAAPSSSADAKEAASGLVSAVLSETARFRARAVAAAAEAAEAAEAVEAASFSPPPPSLPRPASPPPLRRILVSRLGSPHPAEAAAWRDLLFGFGGGGAEKREGEGEGEAPEGDGGGGGGDAVAAVSLSFDPLTGWRGPRTPPAIRSWRCLLSRAKRRRQTRRREREKDGDTTPLLPLLRPLLLRPLLLPLLLLLLPRHQPVSSSPRRRARQRRSPTLPASFA